MTREQKYVVAGELDLTMDQLEDFADGMEDVPVDRIIGIFAELADLHAEHPWMA